jgi:hypothetical protein
VAHIRIVTRFIHRSAFVPVFFSRTLLSPAESFSRRALFFSRFPRFEQLGCDSWVAGWYINRYKNLSSFDVGLFLPSWPALTDADLPAVLDARARAHDRVRRPCVGPALQAVNSSLAFLNGPTAPS